MIKTLLIAISIFVFILAAIGITSSHVVLVPLGLAIYASSEFVK